MLSCKTTGGGFVSVEIVWISIIFISPSWCCLSQTKYLSITTGRLAHQIPRGRQKRKPGASGRNAAMFSEATVSAILHTASSDGRRMWKLVRHTTRPSSKLGTCTRQMRPLEVTSESQPKRLWGAWKITERRECVGRTEISPPPATRWTWRKGWIICWKSWRFSQRCQWLMTAVISLCWYIIAPGPCWRNSLTAIMTGLGDLVWVSLFLNKTGKPSAENCAVTNIYFIRFNNSLNVTHTTAV